MSIDTNEAQTAKTYPLFLQCIVRGEKLWSVGFRSSPTPGIEATGRSPTVEEIEDLLTIHGVPWMTQIVQAAHAAGLRCAAEDNGIGGAA